MRDFEEDKLAVDVPVAEMSAAVAAADEEARLAQDRLAKEKCLLLGSMVYHLALERNGLGESGEEDVAVLTGETRKLLAELGLTDLLKRERRSMPPPRLPQPQIGEQYPGLHVSLRSAIEQSGMSLRAIGEAAGLSHTGVVKVREGKATMRAAQKLAAYFNISVE